jgi:hypothetical protein
MREIRGPLNSRVGSVDRSGLAKVQRLPGGNIRPFVDQSNRVDSAANRERAGRGSANLTRADNRD